MDSLKKIVEEIRRKAAVAAKYEVSLDPNDMLNIANHIEALQAEPVAWICAGGDVSRSKKYLEEMGFNGIEPLYAAPPAPAVDANPPKLTAEEACRLSDSI